MIAPRNLEAERAVLGACLVGEAPLAKALSVVGANDFYLDAHREAFRAISAAAEDHKELDRVVIAPYCSAETMQFIRELYDAVPTASNAVLYARDVKRASQARRVLNAADRIKAKCLSGEYEDVPEYALSLMEEIATQATDKGVETYAGAVDEFRALVASRRKNEGVTGIRTGLSRMDRALGGLNKGLSYIIAARPAVGKSLVVGQLAQTAANQGYRVLLQTPEMSAVQYLDRIAHSIAGVDYERGLEGRISAKEEQAINGAAHMLSKLPLYIDDHGTQTAARIRANVLRYKPDLLLVDYLQYVTPDDTRASREQQVAQVSRALTRIKSDFSIPVVVAAQLNRGLESRTDKRPTLADLRESGQLEQDADAVMFLHREARYSDDAPEDELEIHCEKWRFGSTWQTTVYLKPGANWLVNSRGDVA